MRAVLLSVVMLVSSAQTSLCVDPSGTVKGLITDVNGAVVPDAMIFVVGWRMSMDRSPTVTYETSPVQLSNSKGEFNLRLKPGNYDVYISHPALLPKVHRITVKADKETVLKFQPKPDPSTRFIG